ncbi:MAG: Ig-like domain-containing protein [Propionibacteriaceae bacterium]|nr:Ig-like domain-containing protein [Propionibacteriaceae bacterium]
MLPVNSSNIHGSTGAPRRRGWIKPLAFLSSFALTIGAIVVGQLQPNALPQAAAEPAGRGDPVSNQGQMPVWTTYGTWKANWVVPVDQVNDQSIYWTTDDSTLTSVATTPIGSTVNMVWQAYGWSSDNTTYKTRAVLAFERIAPTPAGQTSFDTFQFDTNMIGRIGGTRDNPTGALTMYFMKNTAPRSNGPATCDSGYTPVVRVTVGQSDIQYACMPAFKMAGGFNQGLANGHATGGEIDQYTGNLYVRIAWNGGAAVDNQSSNSTAASSESEWTFGIWDPTTGKYSMSGSVQPGDWYQGMATVPQERVKVRQNVSGSGSSTPGAPCDIALDADGNAYTYSGSGLSATSAGNMSLVRMEPARDASGNIVDGTAANPWRYYVVEKINKDPFNANSWWSSGSNIWGNAFINGQFLLGGGTGIYNKPASMPATGLAGGDWSGTTRMVKIDPLTGLARVIWSVQNDQLSTATSRDNMSPEQAQIIRGVIYNDANGDGKIDNGEVGIPDQTVALYAQQADGSAKLMLSSQTTDSTGQYSFIVSGSSTQTYYVRPVQVQAPVLGGTMVNATQTWGAGSDEVGYNSAGQQVHNVATVKCLSGDITSETGGACNGALPLGSPDPTPGALGSTSDPSTWASYATVVFATSQQVPSADFGFSAFGSYGDAAAGPTDSNVPAHINGTGAPEVFLGNTLGAYTGPATDNKAHNATDDGVAINSKIAPFSLTDDVLAASKEYPMIATVSGSQASNAHVTGWTTGAGNDTWNTTPVWTPQVFGGTTGTTATGNYQFQSGSSPAISGTQPVQMRVNASLNDIKQPTNAGGEYYGGSGSTAWTTPGEIEDYLFNVADSVYRPAAQTDGPTGTFSFGMTGSSWTTSITAGHDPVVGKGTGVAAGVPATMTATVPNADWDITNVAIVDSVTGDMIQPKVDFTFNGLTASWTYTPATGEDVTALVTFKGLIPDPTQSTLVVSPEKTDLGKNITATVTAKTRSGALVPNEVVTFSGSDPKLKLSTTTCTTDANGTCNITVSSNDPGKYQVSATVVSHGANVDVNGSPATVEFTYQPVFDPANSDFTVSPDTLAGQDPVMVDIPNPPTGTATSYTAILTANDQEDQPMPNLTASDVNFTATDPNVSISALKNNGDGTYTVQYTSKKATSTATASVTVDQIKALSQKYNTNVLPIPFVHGLPVLECADPTIKCTNLSADPLNLTTKDASLATAYITDYYGNPVEGFDVTFSSDGSATLNTTNSPYVQPTDATGHASVTVKDNTAEAVHVSATIPYQSNPAAEIKNSPVTITFTPPTCDDDTCPIYKNSYFTVDPVVDPTDRINMTGWPTVTVPGLPDGTLTHYTATLTILDDDKNPISNLPVSAIHFMANSQNSQVNPQTMVTITNVKNNGDGTYTVQYSTGVSDYTMTASVSVFNKPIHTKDSDTEQALPIPFRPGPIVINVPDCTQPIARPSSNLSANPTQLDVSQTSTAKALVTDANCNPIPDVPVTFGSDGNAAINANQPPQVVKTDVDGIALASVTDSKAEVVNVSAAVPIESDLKQIKNSPVPITFTGGVLIVDPNQSSVSVEPTTQVVGALVKVTITARTADKTPVPNIPISQIQVSGSKGSGPNDSASVTNCAEIGASAPGVYTCDMTAKLVGQYTVSAVVTAVPLNEKPTVTFVHGAVCVNNCTPVLPDNAGNLTRFQMGANDQLADGNARDTATAFAYDVYGNAVPDANVEAVDQTTGDLANILNPRVATATTGADGTAEISWTATQPGIYTAQGTIDGLNPTVPGKTGVLNQIRFALGIVDAAHSSLEITPPSPIAAGQTYTLKATARDKDNHLVPAAIVSFSVNPATASLSDTTCRTLSDGTCTVTLTSNVADTYTVHATVPQNGVPTDVGGNGDPTKASPQTVVFTNGPVCVNTPDCKTHVTIDPNGAVANGTSQDKVNVFAFDQLGNPVAGALLNVTVPGEVHPVGATDPKTDAQGTASIGYTSTTAGSYPITVTLQGQQVPVSDTMNFTHGNGMGSLSITPDKPQQVGSHFTVTAKVADDNGNPVSGQNARFPAVADLTINPTSCTTGADGTCTVDVTSTVVGKYTISATDGSGAVFGNTVEAQFTNGPVCGPEKQLAAGLPPTKITRVDEVQNGARADGVDTDVFSVWGFDCYGNAVPNATVASTTTSPDLTIQSPIGATDANGNSTIWYTSNKVGSYQADVSISSVDQGTPTTVTPQGSPVTARFGPPVNPLYSSWSVSPAGPLIVGQDAVNTYTLTATLADDNHQPSAGSVISFRIDPTGPTFPNGSSCTADASGKCTVTVWSTKSGTYAINAVSAGQPITSANSKPAESVVWKPDVVCAHLSGCDPVDPNLASNLRTRVEVTYDGAFADGDARDTAKVYAFDKWGNPVPAMLVASTSQSGDDLKVQEGISPTGDDGTSTIWYSSTKAGQYQAAVTVDGKLPTASNIDGKPTGTNVITLNFVAGPPDLEKSTLTVKPTSLMTGESATATATLMDKNGNLIKGGSVTFHATNSAVFANPTSSGTDIEVTNDQGVATTTLTDNTVETTTVTGTVLQGNGQEGQFGSVDVTFGHKGADLNKSKLIVDNNTPTVGDTVKATANIVDQDGNPIEGYDVSFAIDSGTKAGLTVTSGTTDATGNAYATLTDDMADSVVLHATVKEGEVSDSPQTVAFQPNPNPDGNNTKVSVFPTQQKAGSPVTVTVDVRDLYNNPIPGIASTDFAVTGISQQHPEDVATVSPCAEVGPSQPGTYTCELTATKVGTYEVTAVVRAVEAVQHPTVEYGPAGVSSDSYFEMTKNDAVANGSDTDVATAHALDRYGNVVPNATVVVVDKSTGDLSGVLKPQTGTVTTGPDGTADVSWTATKVGTYTAEGTFDGIKPSNGSGILNQIRFIPGPYSLPDSTLEVTPPGPIQVGETYTLTATVRDTNKNVEADATVSFSVNDPTNASLSDTTCLTLSTGQCSVTLTSTVAGSYEAHATLPGPNGGPGDITGSPVQLQFAPGPLCVAPSCLSRVEVDPNSVLADGKAQDVIHAYAYDSYNNPIPGADVAATSTPAGLTLATPANPKTDANGTAILGYTATTDGTYTVPVTINGQTPKGSPADLIFTVGVATTGKLTIAPTPDQPPLAVNENYKVTAQVTDDMGHAVANKVVTFPAVDNLTFDQTTCNTGADGTCSVNVTSKVTGTYTIGATSPGVTFNTVQATFKAGPLCVPGDPGAPTNGNVTRVEELVNGVYYDGVQRDIFRVYAYDCDGNAKPDVAIASTPADQSGSVVTVQPDIAPTGADGTSTIWYTSKTPGSFKFDVTVTDPDTPGVHKTPQGSPINVIFGPVVDNTKSSWTVTPNGPLVVGTGADNSYTLTAALHDTNDKPVQGAAMSFATAPNGPTFPNGATCLSAADGTCTVQVYSTKSGTYNITATTSGKAVMSAAGNPAESRAWKPDVVCTDSVGCLTNVKVTQDNVVANGDARDQATLTAYDKYDNPVPGALVQSVTQDSDLRIQQGIKGTDDNGVSTIWYSSFKSGAHVATVTVDGQAPAAYQSDNSKSATPGQITLNFIPGPPDANHSVLSIDPTSPTTDDTITVTADIKDIHDNPVPGATVSFSTTGQATLTPASSGPLLAGASPNAAQVTALTAVSGPDGKAVVTMTDTKAETVTLRATIPVDSKDTDIKNSPMTVKINPVPWPGPCLGEPTALQECTNLSVDPPQLNVGALSTARAHVTDKYYNPAPGVTVTFTLDQPGSTGILVTTQAVTDADGNAFATVTDTVAEAVKVHATITQGELDKSPQTVTFTNPLPRIPDAPTITAPKDGTLTNQNPLQIAGTGEAGATVKVMDTDGTVVCTTTVSTGTPATWSCSAPLADGQHTLTATQTNAGGTSNPSNAVHVTVDTVPPAPPVVNVANATKVAGTAEPNSTVTIKWPDGTVTKGIPVDSTGAWSVPTPAGMESGNISVTATDAAGNESQPTIAYLDTKIPAAPVIKVANGTEISGTADKLGKVIITYPTKNGTTNDVEATINPDFTWSIPTPPDATDGIIHAVVVDLAGNVSPEATHPLDVTPPAAPVVGPSNGTLIYGTAEAGGTMHITDVNGNPIPGCENVTVDKDSKFSCAPTPALSEGTVVKVSVSDAAGNMSPTVQLVIGKITIDFGKPTVAPLDTQTVTGSNFNPGETVTLTVDGQSVGTSAQKVDENGKVTFTFIVPGNSAEGLHTGTLTATQSGTVSGTYTVVINKQVKTGGEVQTTSRSFPIGLLISGSIMVLAGLWISPKVRRQFKASARS